MKNAILIVDDSWRNRETLVDILKDKWTPAQNIASVMKSLGLLLSEPNPSDPLNPDLANLYKNDEREYIRKIKLCCEKYATK